MDCLFCNTVSSCTMFPSKDHHSNWKNSLIMLKTKPSSDFMSKDNMLKPLLRSRPNTHTYFPLGRFTFVKFFQVAVKAIEWVFYSVPFWNTKSKVTKILNWKKKSINGRVNNNIIVYRAIDYKVVFSVENYCCKSSRVLIILICAIVFDLNWSFFYCILRSNSITQKMFVPPTFWWLKQQT